MSSIDAIWTPVLSKSEGDEYDAFVVGAKGGHFSQTRAWGKLLSSNRVGTQHFLAQRSGRVIAAGLVRWPLVAGVALPFFKLDRGPVLDDPADADDVLEALVRLARSRFGLRLSVMPYWSSEPSASVERALLRHGFADTQSFAGSHVRSLRLDLTALPREGPFEGSALSKVRREIRRAERAGAIARPARQEDIAQFRALHESQLHSQGKRIPRPEWYDRLAAYFLVPYHCGAMFVSELDGDLLSAAFVARHGSLATYFMGVSTARELPFPKAIQPLALAISWAKDAGLTTFDLGGIPVEGDSDAKRASIAEFKRSFTRTEVAFVHEHARWLFP